MKKWNTRKKRGRARSVTVRDAQHEMKLICNNSPETVAKMQQIHRTIYALDSLELVRDVMFDGQLPP